MLLPAAKLEKLLDHVVQSFIRLVGAVSGQEIVCLKAFTESGMSFNICLVNRLEPFRLRDVPDRCKSEVPTSLIFSQFVVMHLYRQQISKLQERSFSIRQLVVLVDLPENLASLHVLALFSVLLFDDADPSCKVTSKCFSESC